MLVQRHMDRLGGVERLHEQIYSAVTTRRRESLDMALMHYGTYGCLWLLLWLSC